MRHVYLLLILPCVLFVSCNGSEEPARSEQAVTTIQVDPDEAEPLPMSDYFSDINYYYLKSPEERPIGRIRKLMFQDNYIALYDEAQNSVWVYTNEVSFVNEIKIPEGRGPGELTSIFDVIFTKDNKIHALGVFKIVVYNLEGQFEDEIAYDFSADRFINKRGSEGEGYFIYAGNLPNKERLADNFAGHNLISVDNGGNPQKSFLPIADGKEEISLGVPNNFPRYNGQQLFFAHLIDTIYSINGEKLSPKYALDYGDYAVPEEVFDRRDEYGASYRWGEFMENEIEGNYIAYLSYFHETDRFLHFSVSDGNTNYVVVHDKITETTKVSPDQLTNDIDYGKLPYMFEAHDNVLYTAVGANFLLRHLDDLYQNDREKYNSPKMKKLRNLADSIDENSNPVLIAMPFKEKRD